MGWTFTGVVDGFVYMLINQRPTVAGNDRALAVSMTDVIGIFIGRNPTGKQDHRQCVWIYQWLHLNND